MSKRTLVVPLLFVSKHTKYIAETDTTRIVMLSPGITRDGIKHQLTVDVAPSVLRHMQLDSIYVAVVDRFQSGPGGTDFAPIASITSNIAGRRPAWADNYEEIPLFGEDGKQLPLVLPVCHAKAEEVSYTKYARIKSSQFHPWMNTNNDIFTKPADTPKTDCRKCGGKTHPYKESSRLCLSAECGLVDKGQALCPVCRVEAEKVWTMRYGTVDGCHIHGPLKDIRL